MQLRGFLLSLALAATPTVAAPVNDNCWNAIEINEYGNLPHPAYFVADLDGATSDVIPGLSYPDENLPGVWFKTKQLSRTRFQGVSPCITGSCFAGTPIPAGFGINYFAGSSCDSLVHRSQRTYSTGTCDIIRRLSAPVLNVCEDIYIRIYDTTLTKPRLHLAYHTSLDDTDNPSFATTCDLERNRGICADVFPPKGPDWIGPVEGFAEVVNYQGAVCTGLANGFIPCNANICDLSAYHYWAVYLTADVTYSIGIERADCRLDAVLQLSRGLRTEEPIQCIVDPTSPGFEVFADDENSMTAGCENIPGAAYGDPYISFTPEQDGVYTIMVGNWMTTNVCNDEGEFEYYLFVNPPPSPDDCSAIFEDGAGGDVVSIDFSVPSSGEEEDFLSATSSDSLSNDSLSETPSISPTTTISPSMGPSDAPSNSPTSPEGADGICDNDFFTEFSVFSSRFAKTCSWLAPRNNSLIATTSIDDFPNITAEELLPYGVGALDEFGSKTWGELLCSPGSGTARRTCEETCNTCQDGCSDDDSRYFRDIRGSFRNCLWLREGNPRNHNLYCRTRRSPAASICYETCETCDLQSENVRSDRNT